jgi:Hemerythrin HHE cation binding domain
MYHSSSQEPSEFGTLLREDHQSLFTALEDLLFDETSAVGRLRAVWHAFEAALHLHMTLEEEVLIPRFELVRPADAARIRGEHRQMREQLPELDAGFARGAVDRERLARLLGVLRVSAALKENNGLYDWAEQALRPRDKARLVASIRASRPPHEPSTASV